MKKFWLVSAMAAALMLAACSDDSSEPAETDDAATEETTEESSSTETEETAEEESAEPELYLAGDEVTAGDLTVTVTDTGVAEQIDDTNRVYEINMTVTNNGEEEVTLSSEDFILNDLADEEKTAYGDPEEWTVAAGETVEGSLQYESAATTAFKLFGTIGEEEVEWRLPGITSLD